MCVSGFLSSICLLYKSPDPYGYVFPILGAANQSTQFLFLSLPHTHTPLFSISSLSLSLCLSFPLFHCPSHSGCITSPLPKLRVASKHLSARLRHLFLSVLRHISEHQSKSVPASLSPTIHIVTSYPPTLPLSLSIYLSLSLSLSLLSFRLISPLLLRPFPSTWLSALPCILRPRRHPSAEPSGASARLQTERHEA